MCTPDGACGCHPKHVERTCRIISRLLCVASRWTIINTLRFILAATDLYLQCTDILDTGKERVYLLPATEAKISQSQVTILKRRGRSVLFNDAVDRLH